MSDTVRDFLSQSEAHGTGAARAMQPQLVQPVESAGKPKNKKKSVEAYDIAPKVRQQIADEFLVVKSSRRLARKYRIAQHVISDILHLCGRREPQRERLALVDVLARRTA
jgi:hypothetical protein